MSKFTRKRPTSAKRYLRKLQQPQSKVKILSSKFTSINGLVYECSKFEFPSSNFQYRNIFVNRPVTANKCVKKVTLNKCEVEKRKRKKMYNGVLKNGKKRCGKRKGKLGVRKKKKKMESFNMKVRMSNKNKIRNRKLKIKKKRKMTRSQSCKRTRKDGIGFGKKKKNVRNQIPFNIRGLIGSKKGYLKNGMKNGMKNRMKKFSKLKNNMFLPKLPTIKQTIVTKEAFKEHQRHGHINLEEDFDEFSSQLNERCDSPIIHTTITSIRPQKPVFKNKNKFVVETERVPKRRLSDQIDLVSDLTLEKLQGFKFGEQNNEFQNYTILNLLKDREMYTNFIYSTMERYRQIDLLDRIMEHVPTDIRLQFKQHERRRRMKRKKIKYRTKARAQSAKRSRRFKNMFSRNRY